MIINHLSCDVNAALTSVDFERLNSSRTIQIGFFFLMFFLNVLHPRFTVYNKTYQTRGEQKTILFGFLDKLL